MADFRAEVSKTAGGTFISFFVGDVDLADLVNQEFRKSAPTHPFDDCLPWPLSGGDGFDQTILSHTALTQGEDYAYLFVCGCGEPGCSATIASVSVTDTEITLSGFRTHVSGIGGLVADVTPLVFDRGQFTREANRLREALQAQ